MVQQKSNETQSRFDIACGRAGFVLIEILGS